MDPTNPNYEGSEFGDAGRSKRFNFFVAVAFVLAIELSVGFAVIYWTVLQ